MSETQLKGPQVAFAMDAYFSSSDNTDIPEIPQPKNGIENPWDPAQAGLRAWRKEWRAVAPNRVSKPYWNPGLRRLTVSAKGTSPQYLPADGNLLALNLWDLEGDSQDPGSSLVETKAGDRYSAAYVQITAIQYASNKQDGVYVNPADVFTSFCWGGEDKGKTVPFPAPAAGTHCSSLVLPQGIPIWIGPGDGPSGGHRAQPGANTQQSMNVGRLATLQFGDVSKKFPPPCSLHITVALFLEIVPPGGSQSVLVFDDPEMDATSP